MTNSSPPTDSFDPKGYWQNRLAKKYALGGVGHQSFGEPFNRWMYRVRRSVFLRTLSALNLIPDRVLDIGSGTGFYLDCWKEHGVSSVHGVDITEVAVARLSEKYPDSQFWCADIGDPSLPDSLEAKSYEVISAMDVLFHITDDDRFHQALSNAHGILDPGGYFIWTGNFLHTETKDEGHIKHRSLQDAQNALSDIGFKIVSRRPFFYLMNQPIDCPGPVSRFVWRQIQRLTRRGEYVEGLTGAALYPIEIALTRLMSESPTTELMVCRKQDKR